MNWFAVLFDENELRPFNGSVDPPSLALYSARVPVQDLPAPAPPRDRAVGGRWLAALALALAVAVGGWQSAAGPSRQVAHESQQLRQLAGNLQRHRAPNADPFRSLDARSAVIARLVPAPMLRPQTGLIRSPWGTDVALAPHGVLSAADGFTVTYSQVPAAACQALAQAMGNDVYDLTIEGRSVMGADGPEPSAVEARCARDRGASMAFVFHPDLEPGTVLRRQRG